jgi:hypothetical protein
MGFGWMGNQSLLLCNQRAIILLSRPQSHCVGAQHMVTAAAAAPSPQNAKSNTENPYMDFTSLGQETAANFGLEKLK